MQEALADLVSAEWVHLTHAESSSVAEVYGFAGSQGFVNLEGIRFRPVRGPGVDSSTLLIFMHPASSLQLLPVPRALAARGLHVLCASSRYVRNDTGLIMEKVALDLACFVRHARAVWGYRNVVLDGWSGGGSLALFYQSQAEAPTITATPAGDPCDLTIAGLVPADAVIFHAAHQSRAVTLSQWLDPSVIDEANPDRRELEFDVYNPACPNKPPFSQDFVERYRRAQLDRMRRRTAWVKDTLDFLRIRPGEAERGFVNHRTMADLRFLDPAIDPNDRQPGACYLGVPALANTATAGIARYSSLRSWLSQWSIDDTHALGLDCARRLQAPLLVIENSADDAVPAPDTRQVFAVAGSTDKMFEVISGATHYYQGQPELMNQCCDTVINWLIDRNLAF